MLVQASSLGWVSPEAAQAVAAAGGMIVKKPPTPGWLGPFKEPEQYIAVFPGGLQISADNLSYAIAQSDPGSERSIIQQMLTTVAYEQTGSVPQAVAAAQQVIPPTIPVAYTSIYAQQAPAAAPAATATPSQPQITATYYPRVSLTNLTNPGARSFRVRDEWVLQIAGAAPNRPVTVIASHNSRNLGTSSMGSTDAAGFVRLGGRMSENEIGHWEQHWKVGDQAASPALSFDVTVDAVGAQAASGGGGAGTSLTWRATGAEVTQEQGAANGQQAAADVIEFARSVPWYLWAAAAAGVLLLRRRSR